MAHEHIVANLMIQEDWYLKENLEGMAASLVSGGLVGKEDSTLESFLDSGLNCLYDFNNKVDQIIKEIQENHELVKYNHSPLRLISKLRTFKTLVKNVDQKTFIIVLASFWFKEYTIRNLTQKESSDSCK